MAFVEVNKTIFFGRWESEETKKDEKIEKQFISKEKKGIKLFLEKNSLTH